jgi:hypothetical protein
MKSETAQVGKNSVRHRGPDGITRARIAASLRGTVGSVLRGRFLLPFETQRSLPSCKDVDPNRAQPERLRTPDVKSCN